MTASSSTWNSDHQQLYGQIRELITFALPLADRLVAAGSWDNAVAEGKQLAADHALRYLHAQFQGQTGEQTIDMEAGGDAIGGVSPPPSVGLHGAHLLGTVGGLAGAPHLMGLQAGVQALRIAQEGAVQYVAIVEQERTARHDITAKKEIRLAEIESVRVTLENYLTRTFDERRANFDAMFARLDVAQNKGDVQSMQAILAGILDLAKSSPFKDLASFKASLDNPDFVLEL